MPSDAYDRFAAHVRRPVTNPSQAESLDLAALSALRGEDRAAAEALLVQVLAEGHDARIAPALASLGTPTAKQALERAINALPRGSARLSAAHQLTKLGSPAGLPIILDDLQNGTEPLRRAAGEALRAVPTIAADNALLDQLRREEDKDARFSLWGVITEKHRLDGHRQAPSPVGTIVMRLNSPMHTVRDDAIEQLRGLVFAVGTGHSPSELGLTDTASPGLDALRDAARKPGAALDLAAVDGLSDPEKRWLGEVVLAMLHNDDPRLPGLAARTLGDRASGPLRERSMQASGPMKTAIDAALSRLP